jgi:cytochrome c oxidase assembly protein subunit 15
MTGGIYFEHAHRLFGALVGLTTIVVAWRLWRTDGRSWVRRLAVAAVAVVIVQGLLGGLRVTGRFTLSQLPEEMAPSVALAVVHGVLGQVFLGLMVVLACAASRGWREAGDAEPSPAATIDRSLQGLLIAALVVQLVLGAIQRHLAQGLLVHIVMATVVTVLALAVGVRAWGLHGHMPPLGLLGRLLMAAVGVQVTLGIAALAVTGGRAVVGAPTGLEVTMTTAHQAFGAALLALSVALAAFTRQRLQPQPAG